MLLSLTELVVGFESNFISVPEDINLVELCVRIITSASLLPTHTEFNFSLNLISTPGSAGMNNLIASRHGNNLFPC